MNRLVKGSIIVVCLVLPLSVRASQIVLTQDQDGVNCNIPDGIGLINVHMVIVNDMDVAAVQFGAPVPPCWTGATWLAENIAFEVFIGTSQVVEPRGLSIAFGGCESSPVYLGTMFIMSNGLSQPCCKFPVIKVFDVTPGIDGPIKVECSTSTIVEIGAGVATVNPTLQCNCIQAVAIGLSTWGAIKDMYKSSN